MNRKQALSQWQEMKFGLFIHWGIYSLLERGEWVMHHECIPIAEYEKLAARFNPVKYAPREWVRIAKDAGMRYMIITAKHHDGFSMFKTKVSPFNIVDATPYKRDTIAELAEACREGDIKLGFYYSHVREWRHPMAQSFESQHDTNKVGNYGNYWDYPEECRKNLQVYIDEFDIPQLKELLTQYGDVLTIWFDTPSMLRPDQAEPLRDLIYELQPACLVNSRVGDYVETDYRALGDNEIPMVPSTEPWETPMTMSRSGGWGYSGDGYFGEAREMIRSLVKVVSNGGNLLLNVGPNSLGEIPQGAQVELAKVGVWIRKNGEAIYGTSPSPFKQPFSWGKVTRKENKLYLFVYEPSPKDVVVSGLYSSVLSCKHLATGKDLRFTQEGSRVTIDFHRAEEQSELDVIAVTIEGELRVEEMLTVSDEDGRIVLPMCYACLEKQPGSRLFVSFSGVSTGWLKAGDGASWDFLLGNNAVLGEYRIAFKLACGFWGLFDWDHEVEIDIAGQTLCAKLEDDGEPVRWYQERLIPVGTVRLEKTGTHHCTVKGTKIGRKHNVGLTLLEIILTPMKPTTSP
ncbi:MAG: alpha-L-fucosidase [Treponema sp.]|jgi:alpha-L-fucosidase|nr:alpha-L-fucosidase [Treponema sp.]